VVTSGGVHPCWEVGEIYYGQIDHSLLKTVQVLAFCFGFFYVSLSRQEVVLVSTA